MFCRISPFMHSLHYTALPTSHFNTLHHTPQVRKSFETFDLDKTGFINRNELVIALDTLGVRADQNFVTSLLNSADR